MKPIFALSIKPRLISLGFWAKVVFDELVRINDEFGFHGTIPQAFCELEYIQWRLNLKPSDLYDDEDILSPRKLIKEQLAMLSFHACIQDKGDCIVLYSNRGE